jgi:hypothetical protein
MLNHRSLALSAILAVLAGASAYGQAPPAKLKLALPRYEVTRLESLDYVRIPGGQMLIEEEGRPLVPYHVEYVDYPEGYRVQDIILKERSGVETATGLKLPVVILDLYNKEPVAMKPGLYPNRKHAWRVVDLPEGGTKLAVAVYPFDYDPKTTNVTYYRSYDFDIEYVKSSVTLAGLTADKHSYVPSEAAQLRLQLKNTGAPQRVTVGASLLRAATGDTVRKLQALTLEAAADTSPAAFALPTRGIPNGDYYADVAISDAEGKVLDKKQVSLRIGIPAGKLTGLKVVPQQFRVGDEVKLSLDFENTGSTTLSGRSILEIRVKDSVVARLTRDFEGLAPGKSRQFTDSWKTGGAKENALYRVVGYVSYEATATQAEQVVISTNAAPSAEFTVAPETLAAGLEVKLDAGGSGDSDGKVVRWQWEFGDGGEAEGVTVNHIYSEPGEFPVALTVTDDGGRQATATKTLKVPE